MDKEKLYLENDIDEGEVIPFEDNPIFDEPTEEDETSAVNGLLTDAIQDTWAAIDTYNSYITTLRAMENDELSSLIETLENIRSRFKDNLADLEKQLLQFDESL